MFDVREPSIEALRAAPVKFRYREPKGVSLGEPSPKRAERVRKMLVDSFTAGAILAVYDAANADNKAKLERMVGGTLAQFQRVAAFAFKCVK